ncbi:E3 ubiquitin-protein ligase RHF2A-like protein [Drosera capensis]
MEAVGMDGSRKVEEADLTSAAAFVEGGIQAACDDSCSICLEEFCESDPSTVSKKLPMPDVFARHQFEGSYQVGYRLPLVYVLKYNGNVTIQLWGFFRSQELLDAVVQERNIRLAPPRSAAIFHHPALGDFEIQHVCVVTILPAIASLCCFFQACTMSKNFDVTFIMPICLMMQLPVGVNDAELEERIIQHLAAAAAMGRARHLSRRDGHRRSSAQGRPHFLVFSPHPNAHTGSPSSISLEGGDGEVTPAISAPIPSSPLAVGSNASPPNLSVQSDPVSASVTNIPSSSQPGTPSNYRSSPSQSSPNSRDRAGPSDFQSFSEALRSRFNAVSMRYKESITKSTRGWKERWLSRNSNIADIGSDVRREVNTGIATMADLSSEVRREINAGIATMADLSSEMRREVNSSISTASRMIERLETRNRSSSDAMPNNPESSSISEPVAEGIAEASGAGNYMSERDVQAPCAASSGSN